MKKVLIITYYWPPAGGAGVQRWLKFAKYLPEHDWEAIIYTPSNPESPALDHTLLNDVPDNVVVLKRKIWEPLDWYKKITGRKSNEKLGAGFLSESGSSGFTEKIAIWIRGNFFIPDAKCFWIKPSIKFLAKYLKENHVDVIVSTGPPHSMHLIAQSLKKQFNIPWIADFRDPWTEIDFFDKLHLTLWAYRKHKKLERSVITFADKVITIGPNMAAMFHMNYLIESSVITNGFDESDLKISKPGKSDKFTILHVGSINKDRNHQIFWESLCELINENKDFANSLCIHFVGKTDISVKSDIAKYELEKYVNFTPYIDHQSAIEMEQKASVLYLPINNTPNSKGILTGKLFEYLAVERPIIAIAPIGGDLDYILKETGAGFVSDFNTKELLKNYILNMYTQYSKGNLFVNSSGIQQYTRRNLTGKLVEELNKTIL